MKRLAVFAALALAAVSLGAQTPGGGISEEQLAAIRQGYAGTPSDKALRNALGQASLSVLAQNAENVGQPDDKFSDIVPTKGITNQKQSGRCWLFTGLNVLRAAAIRDHKLGDFQFSQNFLFFYDQLEKANLFLQGVIDTRKKPFDDREVDWLFQNPIGDGGQFTGVANLVSKYGLVPAEAMPETLHSNATRPMNTQLKTLLRQDGLRLREAKGDLQALKTDMLREIYHILALCLGVPPTEFEWQGKTYTPKSFCTEMVSADLEGGYIMVMNDPCRPYGKVYEIEYDRHVYDGQNWRYVNLPLDRIKEMAIASIRGGDALYFSCDVGKYLDRKRGTLDLRNFDYESLLGVSFTMDKRERVLTHASGSSHAMTLIAVDVRDGKPQRWMVENSWGKESGFKGRLVMTDEWFDEYMFRLVVERKYVPADILRMMEQKPVRLPAWDPMFLPEE
ncbi:MAG: C1 family peptidase [Bacteroidales bacterium]|nr:C1 family peptidase [Bacteroidales bacterium]